MTNFPAESDRVFGLTKADDVDPFDTIGRADYRLPTPSPQRHETAKTRGSPAADAMPRRTTAKQLLAWVVHQRAFGTMVKAVRPADDVARTRESRFRMPHATVVDKSNERVRSMFAEIAGSYDRMNHLLSMNVDKYWRWRTVRWVPPQGDSPILDICTGTGDLAFAYWKASKGRVPIVGADFCPEMLQVGEAKKLKLGITDEVTFVEADAQEIPYDDDSFQLVTVAFGLRNIHDTDRGLIEMTRVCTPGGRVVVLEFSQPQVQPMKAIYGCYFRYVLPMLGRILARNSASAYDYLPQSVGEFPAGQALADRMTSAGLSEVWFRPLTFGIATLYVGTK